MSKRIVITGASSGIGRALALFYATSGASLGLIGRHEKRLNEVALLCREKGAEVTVAVLDIRQREQLGSWLTGFDAQAPVDLLIANAGVLGGVAEGQVSEPDESSRLVFETNVSGVLNTVHPLLGPMMARRSGQVALISSIAAFIPLPDAPSYGASKAAVLSYGRALRTALAGSGVRINVICPGFVTTPMTAQEKGWKPQEMQAERAAVLIARGLARDKPVIVFPRLLATVSLLGGLLPERIRNLTEQAFRFKVDARDAT